MGLCSIPIFGEVISRPSRVGSKRALEFLFVDRDPMTQARAERDFELLSRGHEDTASYERSLESVSNVRVPTLIVWG